jgi:hydrogenase nickel incorporation protein HypA/HybF
MHELSIALSILEIVEEEAERLGAACVSAVRIKLGPLSGVVKEPLLSAFELARENSSWTDCQLEIEEVPIVARCPTCKTDCHIASPQAMYCPTCGTPAMDVIHGRELEVTALEVQT